MRVKDLMRKNFVTIQQEAAIKEVNQLIHRLDVEYILVNDNEDKLVGIVTYSDLFRHLIPSYSDFLVHEDKNILFPKNIEERTLKLIEKPVMEIMTREPETVGPSLPLVEAGALMLAHKVKQLPVVEDGNLLGVIRYTDITWGLMIKNCKYF